MPEIYGKMQKYLSSSLNSVVSIDLETSWAAKSLQEAIQHARYAARFQQKQIQEREEKLLKLYENQQQRTFDRVNNRGSAGSNTSLGSTGGGKVRQMFDERRQKAGIDRSYPLEPLKTTKNTISNGQQTRGASIDRLKNNPANNANRTTLVTKTSTSSRTTVNQSSQPIRNGNTRPAVVNKREIIQSVYNNNNGVETFEKQHIFEDDSLSKNSSKNEDFQRTTTDHRDIVELMNSHNLGHSGLDDEKMPSDLGYDVVDHNKNASEQMSPIRKLTNVGGKLPSESSNVEQKPTKVESRRVQHASTNGSTPLGKTFRKETKPLVKRTVRAAVSSPESNIPSSSPSSALVHSEAPKVVSSNPISTSSSPARSVPQTMQSARERPTSKKSPNVPSTVSRTSGANTKQVSGGGGPRSAVVRDDLTECKYCNRRFASDRLEVHQSICSKTIKKKRKTYDATKHRVEGTELEQYVRRGGKATSKHHSSKPAPAAASKKDWRRTHEEFINAIRSAKQAQAHLAKGGKLADLPPPPPSSNPDYVQCPHCGRKFNEAAAERHIPKCANFQFNKPKPGAATAPPPKGRSAVGANRR